MKQLLWVILLTISLASQANAITATGTVEPYFSPDGGCEQAIVREIDHARTEILIHAYTFPNV